MGCYFPSVFGTWADDAGAKSEKKNELKNLEKDFAQKIWFDMFKPNALLNEMAQNRSLLKFLPLIRKCF